MATIAVASVLPAKNTALFDDPSSFKENIRASINQRVQQPSPQKKPCDAARADLEQDEENIDRRFFYTIDQPHGSLSFHLSELIQKTHQSRNLRDLIREASDRGFRFAGNTGCASTARTNLEKKTIQIHRDSALDRAVLSLSYELINALNHERFLCIRDRFFCDPSPSNARAEEYAKEVLHVEADAMLSKCRSAIELGLEDQIKNKTYLRISQDPSLTDPQKREALAREMICHGTVCGKEMALVHYINQYFDRFSLAAPSSAASQTRR
jgi:hypothetical protein